ncbi:mediator-associated protein 1-like [Dorcoceras hygrometricum]|uniref:Mediator-associated protein 1-like n=1 Tax=Dorcoceras hygrometricum TaxID=472368 RepID=A0A2Z7A8D1_9LAMI|nr:mediator-associated protein 1-like [Dorcoceras hygrometricum]
MAPKSLLGLQSSKRQDELERPTSSEERGDEQESEEEDSSGEEDEDSSEEEEEDQEKTPEILPKSIARENGSGSEPESDDSPSVYKMQPIPKASATASKRKNQQIGNGDDSPKSNKRPKAVTIPPTPGGSGFITRLWNDDDEIALLNRMVDFKKSKNSDFRGAFYDSVKGKLRVNFSSEQLRTKIARLKKRFFNALKKGNGSDPVFSKPHDVMVFELSKKIWGRESGNKNDSNQGDGEKSKKDSVEEEKNVSGEEEVEKDKNYGGEGLRWSKFQFLSYSFDNLVGKFPSLRMSDSGTSLVKEKLSFVGNSKAKELDEKWRQMLLEETDLHYRMLSLMREQIKLALDQ